MKPRLRLVNGRWEGAQTSRFVKEWAFLREISQDQETSLDQAALRVRSRDSAQNIPWARKYLRDLTNNVIGPEGPTLRVEYDGPGKVADSVQDWWRGWGKFGVCSVRGDTTGIQFLRNIITDIATDGEVFIRKHYIGEFGFSLEVVPPYLAPVGLFSGPREKERIICGIEVDSYEKPIAYYFTAELQQGMEIRRVNGKSYIKRPAEEIFHFYLPETLVGHRGIPWFSNGLMDAKMLRGNREAELVASRLAANKGGFYKETGPSKYSGETDEKGRLTQVSQPGVYEVLPAGYDFIPLDPQHPNSDYSGFEKRILRGLVAAWGGNFNSVTQDYADTNYAGLRQANLDVRTEWQALQVWFRDFILNRIFFQGLQASRIGQKIDLSKLTVHWQFPRWQGIDPSKESSARNREIGNFSRSIIETIRERGRDPEEVFSEIIKENEILKILRPDNE